VEAESQVAGAPPEVCRRTVAGTLGKGDKVECLFTDGSSILLSNFLASFIRRGDEVRFPLTLGKTSAGAELHIFLNPFVLSRIHILVKRIEQQGDVFPLTLKVVGEELEHPHAKVLVHPESPQSVIKQADVVSSTTGIIRAAMKLEAKEFIVATDKGIFHKMQEMAPDKKFIEAPTAGVSATCKSCAHCPWMAMNTLRKLAHVLETGSNEIQVDTETGRRAQVAIQRLLDFTRDKGKAALAGDA